MVPVARLTKHGRLQWESAVDLIEALLHKDLIYKGFRSRIQTRIVRALIGRPPKILTFIPARYVVTSKGLTEIDDLIECAEGTEQLYI